MKVINIKDKGVGKTLRKVFSRFSRIVMSIDLFEGTKRGEVIVRRLLFLLLLAMSIYVLLDLLVDRGYITTNYQREAQAQELQPEIVAEDALQGAVVPLEGEERVQVATDTTEDKIGAFVKSYGGRIDGEYLSYLRVYCNSETLKSVIAIAVAETSMGKNTDKKTNFYGWHLNGNKAHDLDSKEAMAKQICVGVAKYYSEVGNSYEVAYKYTGGDRTSNWMKNYSWALERMK